MNWPLGCRRALPHTTPTRRGVVRERIEATVAVVRSTGSRTGTGVGVKGRSQAVMVLALVVLTTACGTVELLAGWGADGGDLEMTTVESGGGVVAIDGVQNEPTTAKVEMMRLASPLGVVALETYDSKLGPCYDVVFPDGRREANCLRASGIDPSKPVTGRPDGSIEGLNGPSWNAGLTEPGIGMFHHGLAHPTVRTVTIEPADGSTATSFPVVPAPNVNGLAVYVAWSPEGLDGYLLAGYDADGCLVDWQPVPFGDGGPGGAGRDCSQRLPDQLSTVELLPGG